MSRLSGHNRSTFAGALARFARDQHGSYVIITALLMPVLIGFAGLAADMGLWFFKHRNLQSAADSAAVSAATALVLGGVSSVREAEAVAASYGFVKGAQGVTVTVNRPPAAGHYAANASAVEVIVTQPQPRYFSALWGSDQVPVSARAVAMITGGLGCVLALNASARAAAATQGSASVVLNGCSLLDNSAHEEAATVGGSSSLTALSVEVVGGVSGESNITTTYGVHTNVVPARDPYENMSYPSYFGCSQNNFTANSTVTIHPGVYCNGMRFNASAQVTMSPGIYYVDRGEFRVNGGATVTGSGVTLVFTSSTGSNWPEARINGGANINLTAPNSGPTAGIAFFGDRNMPLGTPFRFNGGASQTFNGAIYVTRGNVTFAGGADSTNGCTQLVADTITFTGNSNFSLNCEGIGTKPMGAIAKLVE